MTELSLNDDQDLNVLKSCVHDFKVQADVTVDGIIWDIYYCARCLLHVKKERPCPYHIPEIKAT